MPDDSGSLPKADPRPLPRGARMVFEALAKVARDAVEADRAEAAREAEARKTADAKRD